MPRSSVVAVSDRDFPMRLDPFQYRVLMDALNHRQSMFEVEERTSPNHSRRLQCNAAKRALSDIIHALDGGESVKRDE